MSTTTAAEIKSALIAHQQEIAAAAIEKIQTENRDNVREKYQAGLDGWNKSWETFWAIVDRCKFNDRFWIDGFSKYKNDYVSNIKHGAHAAEEIWGYSIFLAGCNASKTPELLHTFTPAEHFKA